MSALVRLALRFRAVTLLLVVVFAGGGGYAATSLNQELFPSLEVPYLIVAATQPGAGPAAVDRQISQPLEAAVRSTGDVVSVTSTSREGVSLVTAEFDFGTDMVAREQQVRDAVAAAGLPDTVGRPTVQRLSPDSFPIYSLAVFGADERALQGYLDDVLAPAIRDVSGVGEVTTAGGNASVVSVVADPVRLAAAGLTTADLTAALQAANLSTPVGGVVADGAQLPVRVVTGTDSLAQVQALPLVGRTGGPAVPLSSVAAVSVVDQGVGSSLSRTDGKPSISLEVVKEQDANTVSVVDGIEQALAENPPPAGISTTEVSNQAPAITQGITDLARDAIIGVVLAIIVILLFLRTARGTLVTGISIPLSLLVGFILMRTQDITLNVLTLGALSVAAGRVIDDAIVVFENIIRLMQRGMVKSRAVVVGTTQMVPAITASTLTTVGVFLPLAFAGGLIGSVFLGFALTVTFALLASLLVAVTVVPVLAQTFLKDKPGVVDDALLHVEEDYDELKQGAQAAQGRMGEGYRRLLGWVLGHRGLTVGAAVLLLVASLSSLTGIGLSLFPSSEPTALTVTASAPAGTSLVETDRQVADLEERIGALPGIERFTTVVGASDNPLAALFGGNTGSSSATLTLSLADGADADGLLEQVDALVRDAGLVGAASAVSEGAPSTSALSVTVTGPDFAAVSAAATAIQQVMADNTDLADVASNLAVTRPEIAVTVDQAEAAAAGVSPSAVTGLLAAALNSTPAGPVLVDGAPLATVVSLDPAAVAGPDALRALPLAPGLTLGQVATITQQPGATTITRTDGARSADVTGTILPDDVGGVTSDVQTAVDALNLSDDVEVNVGGAASTQGDSFASLLVAMVVAVAIVYLVMLVAFGNLLTPLVVLFTLPLAAIGAFPALLVTGRDLGLPAMLGLLMLIGIVVTNAIVLLERVERLKKAGFTTRDALLEACRSRLRPILMTATVTIFALLPLALGLSEGALLSASLATVVIGGLISSTLLTLLVIPAMYSLADGGRRRVMRTPREQPPARAQAELMDARR